MKYSKTRKVKDPVRGTAKSAGIDIFVPEVISLLQPDGTYHDYNESIALKPNESVTIASGLKFNIPENRALLVKNKSGVAMKKSLIKGAELIDEDYQGEVHINLHNVGTDTEVINPGDKITQLICIYIDYVTLEDTPEDELYSEVTERGEGGFGSTGTN